MAFQSGSVNHSLELLETLRLFLAPLGWVEDSSQTMTNGKLLHLHKGDQYLHFKAENTPAQNGFYAFQRNALAFTLSLKRNDQADLAKINPDIGAVPVIDTLQQGPFRYWLFHLENPLLVFCVVEYEADRFEFLMFGELLKYSAWKGGAFLGASWVLGQTHEMAANTGPFQDNDMPSKGKAFVHAELDGFTWLTSGNYAMPGYRLVRGMNFWHKDLMDNSPSAFNGLSTLVPIQVFAERDDGYFSPLGELAHVRYVNIAYLQPGSAIELGNDRWLVFPFHHQGPSQQPLYDSTHNLGYAVRVQD